MSVTIRIKRGTTQQWTTSTRPLVAGELGFDVNTKTIKIGDGTTLWPSLEPLNKFEIDELSQDAIYSALTNFVSAGENVTVEYNDAGNFLRLDTGPNVVLNSDLTAAITTANEYTDLAVSSLGNQIGEDYVLTSLVGNAGGVAQLGVDGYVPDSQISPSIARDSEIITSYNDLTDKPTFSTVATSGSYTDLINKPTLFSGSYADLTNKPMLFSGSYNDLTNKPNIPSLTGYATETYVNTAVSNLVDSAPETLNTLNELAAALGDDANYATTISTALGNKLDSSTASSTYLTQANASSTYATLANPTFTGTVSGINASMVGLGNVDNTSDANKPVSTATQTALNAKLDSSGFTYASITIPVYTATTDLPAASSNHGRWAHVHGEGAMYYAHGGSWYKALSQDDLYITTNAQSSSYTLATSDLGKMIEMSGGGTLTITDSASFPIGFTADILQTGSSQVTIAGNGFTPNATPGLKLRAQWSSATLIKRALNSWVVVGDLSA